MSAAQLQQSPQLPGPDRFDALEHWVIVVREPDAEQPWPSFPYRDVLHRRYQRLRNNSADEPLFTDLPNDKASHVALTTVKPGLSAFELLTLARKLVAGRHTYPAPELGIAIVGFAAKESARVAEAMLAATLAADAQMPDFQSNQKDRARLKTIHLYGVPNKYGFDRTIAENQGNALARYLTALPHNELTPASYRKRIAALAREYGWKSRFFSISQLEKRKAGAFLAVAQGSPQRDGGILRLRYQPAAPPTGAKTLALVGKGICFDTGGINLKPHNYMMGMHEDMEGSAVALGTLTALTRLQAPFPVECWLAICTNHIGPEACNPGDIVTALDGTSIEIVHTDAEGRMVLADTLTLASRNKPALIIDYATLTGACVYALGKAYSGVFSNRTGLLPTLTKAGVDSGERVWPFPMDEDYDKALESKFADIRQCSSDPGVDHILAARFLQRFVKHDCPWIHIDLSAGNNKGGLAHIPTDTTGFGVRFTLNLLLDQKVMG
ncbi:MAG: leucyl aminopeptidase family protein [Gammaproteobacteria bacterium]|nr:leucyl aminopeptidase family protein [Gammaproteobacteria bacterium]